MQTPVSKGRCLPHRDESQTFTERVRRFSRASHASRGRVESAERSVESQRGEVSRSGDSLVHTFISRHALACGFDERSHRDPVRANPLDPRYLRSIPLRHYAQQITLALLEVTVAGNSGHPDLMNPSRASRIDVGYFEANFVLTVRDLSWTA